jgi:hypothetical protein
MYILRIDHSTADFDGWKATFDSDPVDRAGKGVRNYQILRAGDDPQFVSVELTFASAGEAETLLAAMGEVWKRVAGTLVFEPQTRIFEVAESREY